MDTKDPGREPDPTDAGLLKRLAAEIRASEIGVGSMESGNLAIDAVIIRGHEYLSGARPMPDTPAPDEVAQLRAEVARMQDGLRDSRAETAAFSRQITRDKDEIITLTARIAELERENADLKRMVCAVQPSADYESLYCHDTVFRGVTMNWFDARDKMLSAGKEPTDAE